MSVQQLNEPSQERECVLISTSRKISSYLQSVALWYQWVLP
jgi:hypothetical protein